MIEFVRALAGLLTACNAAACNPHTISRKDGAVQASRSCCSAVRGSGRSLSGWTTP